MSTRAGFKGAATGAGHGRMQTHGSLPTDVTNDLTKEARSATRSIISKHGYAELASIIAELQNRIARNTAWSNFRVALPASVPFLIGIESLQRDINVRIRCFVSLHPLCTIDEVEKDVVAYIKASKEAFRDVESFEGFGIGRLCQSPIIRGFFTVQPGDLNPVHVPSTEILTALYELMNRRPARSEDEKTAWEDVYARVAQNRGADVAVESLALPRPEVHKYNLSVAYHISNLGKLRSRASQAAKQAGVEMERRICESLMEEDAAVHLAQGQQKAASLLGKMRGGASTMGFIYGLERVRRLARAHALSATSSSTASMQSGEIQLALQQFIGDEGAAAGSRHGIRQSFSDYVARTNQLSQLRGSQRDDMVYLYACALAESLADPALAEAALEAARQHAGKEEEASLSAGGSGAGTGAGAGDSALQPSGAAAAPPAPAAEDVFAAVSRAAGELLTSDLQSALLQAVERAVSSSLRVGSFEALGHGSLPDMLTEAAGGSGEEGDAASTGDAAVDLVRAAPQLQLRGLLEALSAPGSASAGSASASLGAGGAGAGIRLTLGPAATLGDPDALRAVLPASLGPVAWREVCTITRAILDCGLASGDVGDPRGVTEAALRAHFGAPATSAPHEGDVGRLIRLVSEASNTEPGSGGAAVAIGAVVAHAAAASLLGLQARPARCLSLSDRLASSLPHPLDALAGVPQLTSASEWLCWDELYSGEHGSLPEYLASLPVRGEMAARGLRFMEQSRGCFVRVADASEAAWPAALRALRNRNVPAAASCLASLLAFDHAAVALHLPSIRLGLTSLIPSATDEDPEQTDDACRPLLLLLALMPACVSESFGAAAVLPAFLAAGVNLRRLAVLAASPHEPSARVTPRAALLRAALAASSVASGPSGARGNLYEGDQQASLRELCEALLPASHAPRNVGAPAASDAATSGPIAASSSVPMAGALPAGVDSPAAQSESSTLANVVAVAIDAAESGTNAPASEESTLEVATGTTTGSAANAAEPDSGSELVADEGQLVRNMDPRAPFSSVPAARAFITWLFRDYQHMQASANGTSEDGEGGGPSNPLLSLLSGKRGQRFVQTAISATATLAAPLYKDASHFLSELVQNCDDNLYDPSEAVPTLAFHLLSADAPEDGVSASSALVVHNNERGFRPSDVFALSSAGQSSKTTAGSIGKKGVGFKSVFAATQRAEVHSGYAHFAFDCRAPPDGLGGAGMLAPQWVEPAAAREPEWVAGTKMILPLQSRNRTRDGPRLISRTTLIDGLLRLAQHAQMLLFMRRLRCMRLQMDSSLTELGAAVDATLAASSAGVGGAAATKRVSITRGSDSALLDAEAVLQDMPASATTGTSKVAMRHSAVVSCVTVSTMTTVGSPAAVAGGSSHATHEQSSESTLRWIVSTTFADVSSAPSRPAPLASAEGAPTEVALAFLLHPELFTAPVPSAPVPRLPSQLVHAFLPVADYSLRFVLQADWLLTTSREGVHEDEPFNVWLVEDVIPAAYVAAFSAFRAWFASAAPGGAAATSDAAATDVACARAYLAFLPMLHQSSRSEASGSKLFHRLSHLVGDRLRDLPCLPSASGGWLSPAEALREPCNVSVEAGVKYRGPGRLASTPAPSLTTLLTAAGTSFSRLHEISGLRLVHPDLQLPEETWAALGVRAWGCNLAALVLDGASTASAGTSSAGDTAGRFVAACELIRLATAGVDFITAMHSIAAALKPVRFLPTADGRLTSAQESPTIGFVGGDVPRDQAEAAAKMAALVGYSIQPILATGAATAMPDWLPRLLSSLGVKAVTPDSIVRSSVIPRLAACRVVATGTVSDQAGGADTLTPAQLAACHAALAEWYASTLASSGGRLSSANEATLADARASVVFLSTDGRALRLAPPASVSYACAALAAARGFESPIPATSATGHLRVETVPFLHVELGASPSSPPPGAAACKLLAGELGPALWPRVAQPAPASPALQRLFTAMHVGPWFAGLATSAIFESGVDRPKVPAPAPTAAATQHIVPSQVSAGLGGRKSGADEAAGAIELEALLLTLVREVEGSPQRSHGCLSALLASLIACLDVDKLPSLPDLRKCLTSTPWMPEGFKFSSSQPDSDGLHLPSALLAPLHHVTEACGNRGRYMQPLPLTLVRSFGSASESKAEAAMHKFSVAMGVRTEVAPASLAALLRSLEGAILSDSERAAMPEMRFSAASVGAAAQRPWAVLHVWSANPCDPLSVELAESAEAGDNRLHAVCVWRGCEDLPLHNAISSLVAAAAAGDHDASITALLPLDRPLVAVAPSVSRAAYALLDGMIDRGGYASWTPPLCVPLVSTGMTARLVSKGSSNGGADDLALCTVHALSDCRLLLTDGVSGNLRQLGAHGMRDCSLYSDAPALALPPQRLADAVRRWSSEDGGLKHTWEACMARLMGGGYHSLWQSLPSEPLKLLQPAHLAAVLLRNIAANAGSDSPVYHLLMSGAHVAVPLEPLVPDDASAASNPVELQASATAATKAVLLPAGGGHATGASEHTVLLCTPQSRERLQQMRKRYAALPPHVRQRTGIDKILVAQPLSAFTGSSVDDDRVFQQLQRLLPNVYDLGGRLYPLPPQGAPIVADAGFGAEQRFGWAWGMQVLQRVVKEVCPPLYVSLATTGVGTALRECSHSGVMVTAEGALTVAYSLRPDPHRLIVYEQPCAAQVTTALDGDMRCSLYVDRGRLTDLPELLAALSSCLETHATNFSNGTGLDTLPAARTVKSKLSFLGNRLRLDVDPAPLVEGLALTNLDAGEALWFREADLALPREQEREKLAVAAAQAAAMLAALGSAMASESETLPSDDDVDMDEEAAARLIEGGIARQAEIDAKRQKAAQARAARGDTGPPAQSSAGLAGIGDGVLMGPLPTAGLRGGGPAPANGATVAAARTDIFDSSGPANLAPGSGSGPAVIVPGLRTDDEARGEAWAARLPATAETTRSQPSAGDYSSVGDVTDSGFPWGAASTGAHHTHDSSSSAAVRHAPTHILACDGAADASSLLGLGSAPIADDFDQLGDGASTGAHGPSRYQGTFAGPRRGGTVTTHSLPPGAVAELLRVDELADLRGALTSAAASDVGVPGTASAEHLLAIGRLGERLVYSAMQARLRDSPQALLSWVNEEREAGLPYDLVVSESLQGEADSDVDGGAHERVVRFIEVKTTTRPAGAVAFPISLAEVAFAHGKRSRYELWLVTLAAPQSEGGPVGASIVTVRDPSAAINREVVDSDGEAGHCLRLFLQLQ